jgi:hypothetical protein
MFIIIIAMQHIRHHYDDMKFDRNCKDTWGIQSPYTVSNFNYLCVVCKINTICTAHLNEFNVHGSVHRNILVHNSN